jgi:hypothetical protein
LNHSLAWPLRFNLAILKSLSPFRSRTSATMVSRSAQSLTSSWSRPYNSSSISWGLVISQICSNKQKLQYRLKHTVLNQQTGVNIINKFLNLYSSVLTLEKNRCHSSYTSNSDWTPSATGLKGAKLDGKLEKHCSYADSCRNCHFPSRSRHTL